MNEIVSNRLYSKEQHHKKLFDIGFIDKQQVIMQKLSQKISFVAFSAIFLLLIAGSEASAQSSMKEVEKVRRSEEKSRAKLQKKQAKQERKAQKKQKISKKQRKKDLPKAAQKLSREGEFVNNRRQNMRKGSNGLTNAAKNQRNFERKRRKSLRK